jgi:hypothetical protein
MRTCDLALAVCANCQPGRRGKDPDLDWSTADLLESDITISHLAHIEGSGALGDCLSICRHASTSVPYFQRRHRHIEALID